MAPMFSLMEAEVLKKLRELIGWSHGDGIFAPGGSISNLYGLLAARYNKFPETKTKGIAGLPPMVLFGSQQVVCQSDMALALCCYQPGTHSAAGWFYSYFAAFVSVCLSVRLSQFGEAWE